MTSLKIFQWNCNGLMADINELQHHLALPSNDYDILCLQETFLKPEKILFLKRLQCSTKRVKEDYLNYTVSQKTSHLGLL